MKKNMRLISLLLVMVFAGALSAAAAAPESKRLVRARDFIADEQWMQAIEQLRAAIRDPKETRRDEAFYWLAHSQHHSGDSGAAVETLARLEREFPSSMWVKPGQALRIQIAFRLDRSDVLWKMATPSPAVAPGRSKPTALPDLKAATPVPVPMPMWYSATLKPDLDLQVQALGALMRTDPDKVIPLLGHIAFETDNPDSAVRAVFVLAQSPRPEARATVVRAAKTGPARVKIAAVQNLARFGGGDASNDLLQMYPTADAPVKVQIVKSLGEIDARVALVDILRSEKEATLRSTAIVSLGRAGGADQLFTMFKSEDFATRPSIVAGLFHARAESQLIKIAESVCKTGKEPICVDTCERLSLLGTASAKEYLQKVNKKR